MAEPTRLGHYEVLGTLGAGAMGVVYKGYDPVIQRLVAIKTVRKEAAATLSAHAVERFKNEARAGGRLQHPNIVAVYEYGEDHEIAYIAMEYVEGAGLRDYLSRRTTFDLPQIHAIMRQLLLALGFAHERGVVHRDVKPTNLILTTRGALKLADFGIAHLDATDLTLSGTVLGTPTYMSPEQIQGLTVDGRSDLFSAGVVLYELLAGERPFDGTLATVAYRICHEDPAPPSRSSSLRLPPPVDAVVARALAKKPEARYQTAGEFGEALRRACAAPAEARTPHEGPTDAREAETEGLPPALEPAVLASAERDLARAVGPVARVLVRNAARGAADLAGLYTLLSGQIADPEARRRFLASAPPVPEAVRRTGSDPPLAASPAREEPAAAGPIPPAYVNEAAAKLAVYVGPIAGWLARRAAKEASGREDFVNRLGARLGAQERRAFLRDLGLPEA